MQEKWLISAVYSKESQWRVASGSEQMNFFPDLCPFKGSVWGHLETCWIHTTAMSMLQIAHVLTSGPQLLYVQKQLFIPSKTASLNTVQRVPQNILHHPLLNKHHSEPASLRQLKIETGERISHHRKSANLNYVSPSSFHSIPPSPNTSLTTLVCAHINHSPCRQKNLPPESVLDTNIYLSLTQMQENRSVLTSYNHGSIKFIQSFKCSDYWKRYNTMYICIMYYYTAAKLQNNV